MIRVARERRPARGSRPPRGPTSGHSRSSAKPVVCRPLPLDRGVGIRRAVARRPAALHRHPDRPRPRPALRWRPHPVRARNHEGRGRLRHQPRRTTPGPGPRRPGHRRHPPRRRHRAGPCTRCPTTTTTFDARFSSDGRRVLTVTFRPISVACLGHAHAAAGSPSSPSRQASPAPLTWTASGSGSSARHDQGLRQWDVDGSRRFLRRVPVKGLPGAGARHRIVLRDPFGRRRVRRLHPVRRDRDHAGRGPTPGASQNSRPEVGTASAVAAGTPRRAEYLRAVGGTLYVWDGRTGRVRAGPHPVGDLVTEVDHSPDGSRVVHLRALRHPHPARRADPRARRATGRPRRATCAASRSARTTAPPSPSSADRSVTASGTTPPTGGPWSTSRTARSSRKAPSAWRTGSGRPTPPTASTWPRGGSTATWRSSTPRPASSSGNRSRAHGDWVPVGGVLRATVRRLVSGGADGTVVLWDADDREP